MTSAVVVDASALIEALLAGRDNARLVRRLRTAWPVAPEFVDLEVLNFLRRGVRRGNLPDLATDRVVERLENAPVYRTPCRGLLRRVWDLRDSVTAYDAAYVALAEQLGVPLITSDARLAKAHGHDAEIEFYPPTSP